MELLSKDSEQEAVEIVKKAIANFNDGDVTPSEALVKAAEGCDLTPEMLCRLTEAYNGSAQLSHLEQADEEKRAEAVPLADATEVVAHFFPTDILSKSAKIAQTEVPDSMSRKVYDDFMHIPEPQVKTASIKMVHMRPRTYDVDSGAIYGKIHSIKAAAVREVETLRTEARRCLHKVGELSDQAADYFRSLSHVPFKEAETRVLTHFGDSVKPLMDSIYSEGNLAAFGEKRGSKLDKTVFLSDGAPYSYIKEAVELREKYAEQMSKMAKTVKMSDAVYKENMAAYRQYEKKADVLGDIHALSGEIRPDFTAAFAPEEKDPSPVLLGEISDPEHDARLAAIRQKAVLSDMMANDPVISSVSPEDVISAFNELSSTTPYVAREPALLRSWLRRRVQQADVDPFEVQQMLTQDATLQKRETSAPEENTKVLS